MIDEEFDIEYPMIPGLYEAAEFPIADDFCAIRLRPDLVLEEVERDDEGKWDGHAYEINTPDEYAANHGPFRRIYDEESNA